MDKKPSFIKRTLLRKQQEDEKLPNLTEAIKYLINFLPVSSMY
jgi:hypothetical protein